MKREFFAVAAAIISSHALAQQDSAVLSMKEVVLTASKYPQKQAETGKVMTVINRKDIERNLGRSLNEVLNTAVGTNIIGANSAPGTNQTVSIRGASAGNVLILLDGVPVNDPSVITNYFDLNLISLDQVERIEILKGGQSTLYGSDAVAGVINIISRKAAAPGAQVSATLTGGSYNTFKQNLGLAGRKKGFNYSAGYTHLSSAGFSAAYDEQGVGGFDKDGIDQHSAQAKLGFDLSNRLHINVNGTYNYYRADLDASAFTDEKDFTVKNDNGQAGAGLVYDHTRGSLRFNYLFNYVERRYLDDSTYKSSPYVDYSRSRFIGRTHFAEIYNNWKWNKLDILVGLDYRFNNTDQDYFSTGPFGPYEPPVLNNKMNQLSPYASLAWREAKGFQLEAGARWNRHSEYGNNFTFNLNPSYRMEHAKLFANFYTAFKAPTLYQLFDPASGNKDLEPEKGWIGEAGVEFFAQSSFTTRIVGFYRNTNNSIQYITVDPVNFFSQYRNVSKQLNYGLEWELSYTPGKFNLASNFTYTDGETTSAFDGTGAPLGKDTTYFDLYRIPKLALNLQLGYQFTSAFYSRVQLRAVSEREEFIYGASPETLDGYATVDLYGEYRYSKVWRAFVELRNITDTKYFDIRGYNARRFNFAAGVTMNFAKKG